MEKLDLKQIKKKLLAQQKVEIMAAKKRQSQQINIEHESSLFQEAMSGVSPLHHEKAYHNTDKPKAKRMELDENEYLEIHDPLSDELDVEEVEKEEILSFCRTGIQKKVYRKLRSGSYLISDELDLHGFTIKQAKQVLMYYLQTAIQLENSCIRIIHGKGHRSTTNKPVLKTYVNHWLSEHERVLAFHSTKPKDGGTGAVYVLLKRDSKI